MTQKRDLAKSLEELKPYEEFFWASYLPKGRYEHNSKYKRHQTLGHAKLSVNYVNGSNADGAEIYHWDGSEWVRAYYVDENRNLVKL